MTSVDYLLEAKSDTMTPNGVFASLLSEILYRICEQDEYKFKRVCDMVESAFKAGQQSKE